MWLWWYKITFCFSIISFFYALTSVSVSVFRSTVMRRHDINRSPPNTSWRFPRQPVRIQMVHWAWPKPLENGKCFPAETDSAATVGSWWHRSLRCSTSTLSWSSARAFCSSRSSESGHWLIDCFLMMMSCCQSNVTRARLLLNVHSLLFFAAVRTSAVGWHPSSQSYLECYFSLSLDRCLRPASRTQA